MKILFTLTALFFSLYLTGQPASDDGKWRPLVNQAGYNLGESKRFVCYGAADGTKFRILKTPGDIEVFTGELLNYEGWFTAFNPNGAADEYVIEVDGHGRSVPFWVADHVLEKISSKLAYDFFVDVRGARSLENYDMSKVYGGGPSRDGGAYGLETVFESLFYASNPALFHTWTSELGNHQVPDLIELILWHAKFAYKFHDYNGPVANRHGTLGYEGQPRMTYDYWNTLDQLAVVCAAYHTFLKPYLPEETYRKYRQVCLERWQAYDRHKEVRYWTYSTKWVDRGFQEFNEMGNAFGQSVIRNLFMYMSELHEKNGNADQFLRWAQASADDIVKNWDFNNPRHMWWIRNAEHITPQALALFLMLAPDKAPAGTKEKLAAWAIHMKQKTNNFWKYRVHSETEWAHPATKELGGAPALGGSMFAVSHLLNDPQLRNIGWAQIDFTFGANPLGAHLSNKSDERLKINGYWKGVEVGWPQAHPRGYGMLGLVRGTLDGSPLDHHFPGRDAGSDAKTKESKDAIGQNAYSTEGWCVSNRGWLATITFSTLGSHDVKIFDGAHQHEISRAESGETITIALKAALNQDWNAMDHGWVEVRHGNGPATKVPVTESGINTGVFVAQYTIPKKIRNGKLEVSYGYWGFRKVAQINIEG
jgi:hypothetical protein